MAIREALDTPPEWRVILHDLEDSSIVAVTASLPSGLRTKAEVKAPAPAPTENGNGTPSSTNTRASLLKFERINAHLANERTWLSWVRTTLATITCAFSFLNLSSNIEHWSLILFILGCVFVACALLTYITGKLRFQRLKTVLSMPYSTLAPKFRRFGMGHHATLFGLLIVATSAVYWSGVVEFNR